MKKTMLAPSILAANFRFLDREIKKIIDGGATYLHFDVMDGHFVNNISFGIPVLKAIKGKYPLVNDVHLMISDPYKYIDAFAQAGADIITFHYESLANDIERHRTIDKIISCGIDVGMTIKPETNVEVLYPFLSRLNLVLVMSVEPGFGGQGFIQSSLTKVENLRRYIDEHGLATLIEIDGGINAKTGKMAKEAGVDILVAGSYLFSSRSIKKRMAGLIND
ncbi:MAG: ribulose-phosphate 3-epimerase [Bacilli bacterium]